MSYTSFDPRDIIRKTIGDAIPNIKEDIITYNITVTDELGDTVRVPMLLSEEVRNENLPEMPFIEIFNVTETYKPRCPSGTIREKRCFMDFTLHFIETDRIKAINFKKKILNVLHNSTRTYQSVTAGVWWYTILDTKNIKSDDGKQVYFELIISIYALFTDT